jgi:hypothetical protein
VACPPWVKSGQTVAGPNATFVRYCPKADKRPVRLDCPLSANSGHPAIHSVTSLAATSRPGGMVMSSAFAVLRWVVYENGRVKRFKTESEAWAYLARCDEAGKIIH